MAKLHWANVMLTVMMMATLAITALMVGPAIESRFFPVYSHFQLESVSTVEGGSIAQFRYEKKRLCEPAGFAWFVGEFGATSRQVEVTPKERANGSRPLGWHLTVPYIFSATDPDQVRDGMRAEIYSRCHPFWITRTEIYP